LYKVLPLRVVGSEQVKWQASCLVTNVHLSPGINMNPIARMIVAVSMSIASSCALAAPSSYVAISDCWIRALPGNLPSGGYFKASNTSDAPIAIIGVQADAFGMAMLHQTQSTGDTSRMDMLDKVVIPAKGTLTFSPGGYHIMFEKPDRPDIPIRIGTAITVVFTLSDTHQVSAQCAIKGAAALAD